MPRSLSVNTMKAILCDCSYMIKLRVLRWKVHPDLPKSDPKGPYEEKRQENERYRYADGSRGWSDAIWADRIGVFEPSKVSTILTLEKRRKPIFL